MWGIDRLSAGELGNTRRRLRNSAVALLSQASAVDRRGKPVLDVLEELGVRPVRVFAGEHGFDGAAQAEEAVATLPRREEVTPAPAPVAAADAGGTEGPAPGDADGFTSAESDSERAPSEPPAPSVPPELISLYGQDKASLSPRPEHLAGIDVLLIDLMDVGSRYYTFVWTALLAARAARLAGVHVLVLDRPNPISGDPGSVEGAPQLPGFTSFVGLESVPIRHAMTVGELLTFFLARDGHPLGPDGALSVIATRGWERHRTAHAWGRPFIAPSPNMPSVETALVYPGGCLIEGTNLSEGRGTTLPFQTVGAPFLDGRALARALVDARLPGVMVRPHSFRPTFEKHAGQLCHGVVLHVTDPRAFRPVTTYLTLITLARRQAPEAFEFLTRPYEFENERLAFDLLTGSDAARNAILSGATPNEVVELVAPVPPSWLETLGEVESLVAKAHA
ncbi:MAG TPA: DUF1343 domain-containing protein [Polyangiaceae bacterium]|nr:DUF1343 domain-containing protein [Polyangiaceae bacterium]